MSQDPPIPRQDSRADESEIVEWGGHEPTARRRRTSFLSGLRLDRRLAPLVAGLGVIAGYASLTGEWATTTVLGSRSGDGGNAVRLSTGVSEVGGFGIAYLIGLLGLVGCVALAFFGSSRAVRHNCRVAGLAVAAALLAILLASASSLQGAADRQFIYLPASATEVEYGRGLVTAVLATVLFGLASYLARQPVRRTEGQRSSGFDDDDADDRGGWPWRRRGSVEPGPESEPGLPPPSDLTVTPTVPFARYDQDSH